MLGQDHQSWLFPSHWYLWVQHFRSELRSSSNWYKDSRVYSAMHLHRKILGRSCTWSWQRKRARPVLSDWRKLLIRAHRDLKLVQSWSLGIQCQHVVRRIRVHWWWSCLGTYTKKLLSWCAWSVLRHCLASMDWHGPLACNHWKGLLWSLLLSL